MHFTIITKQRCDNRNSLVANILILARYIKSIYKYKAYFSWATNISYIHLDCFVANPPKTA